MSTLLELADRCEREEPSRELDAAIARFLAGNFYEWWKNRPGPADFTTSIDAAVTLVPADCGFKVETDDWDAGRLKDPPPPSVFACVHDKARTRACIIEQRTPLPSDKENARGVYAKTHHVARAATPALALCAAALRARAAMEAA